MLLEDHIFQGVLQAAFALLYTSLFGLGILVCLAKVSRYDGMVVGAFGCLGLLLLRVSEFLAWMPRAVLSTVADLGPALVETQAVVLAAYEQVEPWHGLEVVRYTFFACLVMALAGRLRGEDDPTTERIGQLMGDST